MNNKNKNSLNFLIFIFIILTPLIIFFRPENFIQLKSFEINYLILLHLLIIFFLFLFSNLILKIFFKKKNIHNSDFLILLGIIYLILFLHQDIRDIISIQGKLRTQFFYYSLILIFFFSSLIFYFFLKKKQKLKYFILLYCSFLIIYNYKNIISNNQISILNNNLSNHNYKIDHLPLKPLKKNIYYILFDGMGSVEWFTSNWPEQSSDVNKSISELNQLEDIQTLKKTLSSYNITYLNLSGLLYGKYFIDENSKKYFSRKFFFPNNLYYNKKNELGVISYLLKNNNFFKYAGNSYFNHDVINDLNISIDKNNKIFFKKLFPSVFFQFYEQTPLDELIRKLSFFFKVSDNRYYLNDPLKRLENYLKNGNLDKFKKGLFFIHQMSPHAPYLYDKNCNRREFYEHKIGIKHAYLCNLKRIKSFLELINTIDPDAIVAFQADHSLSFDHDSIERYKIFTLIKSPKNCSSELKDNINNINTMRFLIFCSSGEKISYLSNKIFRGFYEHEEKYGIIELKKF